MSEETKNMNNETTEEVKDQAPAADQQKPEEPKNDKPERVGFMTKVKTFGKEKVVPAAKLVGKGVAKGASIAGGALATAYLIGMAIGGYTAVKGKTDEEKTNEGETAEVKEAEKPAEDQTDVQISLNEENVQVDSNIE